MREIKIFRDNNIIGVDCPVSDSSLRTLQNCKACERHLGHNENRVKCGATQCDECKSYVEGKGCKKLIALETDNDCRGFESKLKKEGIKIKIESGISGSAVQCPKNRRHNKANNYTYMNKCRECDHHKGLEGPDHIICGFVEIDYTKKGLCSECDHLGPKDCYKGLVLKDPKEPCSEYAPRVKAPSVFDEILESKESVISQQKAYIDILESLIDDQNKSLESFRSVIARNFSQRVEDAKTIRRLRSENKNL